MYSHVDVLRANVNECPIEEKHNSKVLCGKVSTVCMKYTIQGQWFASTYVH